MSALRTLAEILLNKLVVPRGWPLTDATSLTPTPETADVNTQVNTQTAGTLTINAPAGTSYDLQKFELFITCTNSQTFVWAIGVYRGSVDLPLPLASTGGGKTDRMIFQRITASSTWDLLAKNFGF